MAGICFKFFYSLLRCTGNGAEIKANEIATPEDLKGKEFDSRFHNLLETGIINEAVYLETKAFYCSR